MLGTRRRRTAIPSTPLTVHILAAVAQHEREMIAQRTKDALQAAKAHGAVLGNPKLADVRGRAVASTMWGVGTRDEGTQFHLSSPQELVFGLFAVRPLTSAAGTRSG